MPSLHIALQEGFDGDVVVVRVNGKEALRKKDVTTRMQIGLADSVDTVWDGESARVEVEVPTRNISGTIEEPLQGESYLGISILKGAIDGRVSTEPFGYV